jgi:hypothetical protein
MAEATISRWPLTAEARVRARVNLREICGGQSGTGTGFSLSSSVFPCQYRSTAVLHTHIPSGEIVICWRKQASTPELEAIRHLQKKRRQG